MKSNYARFLETCHCWQADRTCPLGKPFLQDLYSWTEDNPLHPMLAWKICSKCNGKLTLDEMKALSSNT